MFLIVAILFLAFRAVETEDSESKTNVIDRAVASLVFHKFDFEDSCIQHQTNYDDDAEVPFRGMQTTNCLLNY